MKVRFASVTPIEGRRPLRYRHGRAGGGHAVGAAACLWIGVLLAGAALVVHPVARAASSDPEIELRANGAPLADVLVHLAAVGGEEARVADGIDDTVAGNLVGEAAALIALLADTHALTVHRDGRTLWFDREGHTVVDFVPLDRPMIVRALETLAAPLAPGGTVQVDASGRGLVLRGSRGYVRTSLARIATATGVEVEPPSRPEVRPRPGAFAASPELGRALAGTPDGRALVERLVLLSSRPPRYAELDDGTRLVIGSTLPDGRRVRGIERDRLVFDSGEAESVLPLP